MFYTSIPSNPVHLGKGPATKWDEFSEKCQRGGGGVIFNSKIYIKDFGPLYRAFYGRFVKNCNIIFRKRGGGESKAVLNFSENSPDLVAKQQCDIHLLCVINTAKRCS